ncbi:MAG: hypothetical protein COC17_08310 [Hyphomicrobiales bacterium]|nr:DUF2061 domain-containing protein [Hyphomicrobiales bacterium]PCH49532.1 MAG: hypothetical protein COC17_08310 [Hyphomicrobiales bacterium]
MNEQLQSPPQVQVKRSIAKAVSWRVVGTIDTFILSFLLITYIGPFFGMDSHGDAAEVAKAASYIALAEVATKMILYFAHERGWATSAWGVSVVDGKRVESYGRTTTKTTTWRVIASIDTTLLAWYFTGSIGTAISIGGLEIITKLVLYFFHERTWANISFGIKMNDDDK